MQRFQSFKQWTVLSLLLVALCLLGRSPIGAMVLLHLYAVGIAGEAAGEEPEPAMDTQRAYATTATFDVVPPLTGRKGISQVSPFPHARERNIGSPRRSS